MPSLRLGSELGGNQNPTLKFQKNLTGYEASIQKCVQRKTNIVLTPLIIELPAEILIMLRELKIKAKTLL